MKSRKSCTVSLLLLGIMSALAEANGVVNNMPFGNIAFMVAGCMLILLREFIDGNLEGAIR